MHGYACRAVVSVNTLRSASITYGRHLDSAYYDLLAIANYGLEFDMVRIHRYWYEPMSTEQNRYLRVARWMLRFSSGNRGRASPVTPVIEYGGGGTVLANAVMSSSTVFV